MVSLERRSGGGILTARTARWADEENREGWAAETFGAECNPTGNPIGGGDGYADVVKSRDRSVRSYEDLALALKEAAAGDVVFVPADVRIDMSGRPGLGIPEAVTLAGDRGTDGSAGGLVYSNAPDTPFLLRTEGDCIRVTGLRFRGPYPHRDRAAHTSNGILTSHFALEIDNCEIRGFSVAATRFDDGATRGYVHHNFIHHNQKGGLGYGVSINGATVLVEANLFDWCRHHVASSGTPGSGYEARYNICLDHANGHLFDMHGGQDRGDATEISGDWMDIHHNTFIAQHVRSVVIRGAACQDARIHHNRCLSPLPENVVRAGGNTRAYQNLLGPEGQLVENQRVES